MKIMLVTDAWEPQVNGVVRTLQTTIQYLRQNGHDVVVVSPDLFRSLPCPSYSEIRLALATPRMIGKRIDREAPDAIHIATEGPLGLCARVACTQRGLQFTSAYHTQFPDYVSLRTGLPISWFWSYVRWFHQQSAHVLTATPTLARQLSEHGILRTRQWSRGVDLSQFYPGQTALPEMTHLPRPVQLYVGRVAVEKNIDAFLSARHAGTKVVVGDGPARASLRNKYPDVVFLGVRKGEQLARAYAGADVFVFPSKTDTFGLVMLEALACGTPVAAYPVQGPLDVIGTEGRGVRAEPRQQVGALHADLDQAISEALTCDRQASVRYARLFDWQGCVAQFVDALVAARDGSALSPVNDGPHDPYPSSLARPCRPVLPQ